MISKTHKYRVFPLFRRLLMITSIAVTAAVLCSALVMTNTSYSWLAWPVGLVTGLGGGGLMLLVLTRNLRLSLGALDQGLRNLLDNDFSVTLVGSRIREINDLILHYNGLTESLRRERQSIYQRELLLDTIIENSTMCVLITDQRRRVIFANQEAESLLNEGDSLKGHELSSILAKENPELCEAIERQQSGIFPLHPASQTLHHLFTGQFVLNAQRHTLVLMKEITREINRQEAASWKRVIRIISHELNNSLAPISSLAHSGQLMLSKGQWQQLPEVLAIIGERTEHLKHFVSRYAEIAKLPAPRKASVDWSLFWQGLNLGYPFVLMGELPGQPGYFDAGQVQQLLLNLLKNAAESGSPADAITLSIEQTPAASIIAVADRGTGMAPEVLKNALLPFYSTKAGGSGVGLPLCREIVDAHEGRLILSNRRNGGLRVKVILPMATA